jgi:hypothetical protein
VDLEGDFSHSPDNSPVNNDGAEDHKDIPINFSPEEDDEVV